MKWPAVLIAIVTLTIAAIVVGSHFTPEPTLGSPLTGDTEHDFGEVRYRDGRVDLTHTFHLTNSSERTVVIADVAPTCGCTVPQISTREIPPGTTTDIEVTLTLTQPSLRHETVWLQLAGVGSLPLTVRAVARRMQEVHALHRSVILLDEPLSILLFASDIETNAPPREPTIETDAAPVSVEFGGWAQLYERNEAIGRPARWHGVLRVQRTSNEKLPRDAKISVKFGEDHVIDISLTGRPWAM